jgi:hypothetical protein
MWVLIDHRETEEDVVPFCPLLITMYLEAIEPEFVLGCWGRRASQEFPQILWKWKGLQSQPFLLSWATWIESTLPHYISSWSIVTLPCVWWSIDSVCPHTIWEHNLNLHRMCSLRTVHCPLPLLKSACCNRDVLLPFLPREITWERLVLSSRSFTLRNFTKSCLAILISIQVQKWLMSTCENFTAVLLA